MDSPQLNGYSKDDQVIIKATFVFIIISIVLLTLYMVGIVGPNLGVALLTIAGVTISTIAYDRWKILNHEVIM